MCESRGGSPGLPVPNNPYGLCGRKATLKVHPFRAQELCVKVEVAVPNSPKGLCGRKATLNTASHHSVVPLRNSGIDRPVKIIRLILSRFGPCGKALRW